MRVIYFIQSVSEHEWEVGEIIQNEIEHNPDYKDTYSKVLYAKNFIELKSILQQIVNIVSPEDYLVIQIDAHSNTDGISFRDVNNPDKEHCEDFVSWDCLQESLDMLYRKFQGKVLLIFVSCCSAAYFSALRSPHVKVFAADGLLHPRRAEELLLFFYKNLCTGKSIEESFDAMQSTFPINIEKLRENKALFYMCN